MRWTAATALSHAVGGSFHWRKTRKSKLDQAASSPAPDARHRGLVLRRLSRRDLSQVEAHFKGLPQADRRNRFHTAATDEAIDAYVRSIDFTRMILIGAVMAESGLLVGLAEAHLNDRDRPDSAEISVSVDVGWRRRALGHRLVVQAVWAAFAASVGQVTFSFLPENFALVRLISRLGARVDLARGQASLKRSEAAERAITR
ncbi:MAG: hypothetical protein QNJ94_10720 [Alphaproteobacteria bacterium]|nr:hypothetical protein [Alphaproteobacteria bacterium]